MFQELEMRIDTQKQTLSARDESIKKLLEMLQTKGEGKEEEARVHQQMQMVAQKQVSAECLGVGVNIVCCLLRFEECEIPPHFNYKLQS